MDYWELRSEAKKIIPRKNLLLEAGRKDHVREKGRKSNYFQFNLELGKKVSIKRLLEKDVYKSFLEISLRAAHCPMPLNSDVWDGLVCSFGCRYCVTGDTKISSSRGKIPIRNVKKGYFLYTYNEVTKKVEEKRVLKTMKRTDRLYLLVIDGKKIKITGEHPVFTKRDWVKVRDLTKDDEVLSFEMKLEWKRIQSVELLDEEDSVYNLEMEDNNNYFAEGFLVHNCYANLFRASLYTSFFDNAREIGMRHCDPEYFKRELDLLFEGKGEGELRKAIELKIPIRFGIRFEDFLPIEKRKGVSLSLLKYLKENHYPVMINTKSDLVGDYKYVKELSENKGKAAVHITMISSNNSLLKKLEPSAPSFNRRLEAAKNLVDAGVRVVARIEPFMVFINDSKSEVDEYIGKMKEVGVKNITFDTYSYSASSPGIRGSFESVGVDFERMFLLMSDCQWMGSLLLGKFQDYFRSNGISCSTFDFGNVPSNSQDICCEVGDYFSGFSYGNVVSAIRFIQREGKAGWSDFESFVERKGGFLSERLREDVKKAWNMDGNKAYLPSWAPGILPAGMEESGNRVWKWEKEKDFREDLFLGIRAK